MMNEGLKDMVMKLNKEAMKYYQNNWLSHSERSLQEACKILDKLEKTQQQQKLLAITSNNLGCLFKKFKKYHEAIEQFFKGLEIQKQLPHELINISNSHLNICAVYSLLGNHELAQRHALKALYLLRNNYREETPIITSLVIAYHNLGVEYEYLNLIPEAIDCLNKGIQLSEVKLGKTHSLTLSLRRSLKNASGQDNVSENSSIASKNFRTLSAFSNSRALSLNRKISMDSRNSKRLPSRGVQKARTAEGSRRKNIVSRTRINPIALVRELNAKFTSKENQPLPPQPKRKPRKRTNVSFVKVQENNAALRIQAFWRGFSVRKQSEKTKDAQKKARQALQELDLLKMEVLNPKNTSV